jgi:hypothetical protein
MLLTLAKVRRTLVVAAFATALGLAFLPSVTAQSLTSGGLQATILDDRGLPIREALVTLERDGVAFRTSEADRAGRVRFDPLAPGSYSLLAEQIGHQPVRVRGVQVAPGNQSVLTIRLTRRPPPIGAVEEQLAEVSIRGGGDGQTLQGDAIQRFDRRRPITDVSRDLSILDIPRDGREGLVGAANGLTGGSSRLFVDGLEEILLRHPGRPGDPASAPLFGRDGISAVSALSFGRDGEWRGTPGAILSAQSTRGGSRLAVTPWATFSGASLGGRALDNPADSSASSFQVGASAGGPLKGDTASWFLRFDFQQLRTPSAAPFEDPDAATFFAGAAENSTSDITRWLAPTVRTWEGFSGQGRVDWSFGRRTALAVRGGMASWSEDNPIPGIEATNGAGDRLDASDLSIGAVLTTQGADWSSETRLGLRNSSREWTGTGMPLSTLLASGSSIGSPFTGGGDFDESALELVQALTYRTGAHTLKVGLTAMRRTTTYSWIPGSFGRYSFGAFDPLGGLRGTYQQAVGGSPAPDIAVTEAGGFLQDAWQLSPSLQLFAGLRFETQKLPADLMEANVPWALASGITTALVPKEAGGDRIAPRVGFTYDAGGRGRTIVRGAFGRVPGRFDLAALAEAAQFNGEVVVHRDEGALAWPSPGVLAGATVVGPALTFFGDQIRRPRSTQGELSLTQQIGVGTQLTIAGGYRHTDFLLRREDVNRPVAPLSTASDGRPIYGALAQYGALVAPTIGSNRRFAGFDAAYAFTSTGYSDSYDATVRLDRQVSRGVAVAAAYTWSRTEDNLVGQLSADPADRLSPLAGSDEAAAWDEGRSDLDIPHRVAATVTLRPSADGPLTLAARFRHRAGVPFTPGYRAGVDINGDGSGGNDPVGLTGAPAGLASALSGAGCDAGGGAIAVRNSCREKAVTSLDLSLAMALSAGGRRLALTLDAFNVVGTTTGLVDRAALLIDPTGSITTNGAGRTVVPVTVNPNFGSLLTRRGEPRSLRIGLRVEN